MQTNIIQIGNSKGLILPAEIMRQMGLKLKSLVNVSVVNDSIVISHQPREGWEAAAKIAHDNGDDLLSDNDVFEDDKIEEWEW